MNRPFRLLAAGTLLAIAIACGGKARADELPPNVAVPWLPPSALTPPVPAPVGPNSRYPAWSMLGRGFSVVGWRLFHGAPPYGGRGPYYGGGWYRPYGYYANRPL